MKTNDRSKLDIIKSIWIVMMLLSMALMSGSIQSAKASKLDWTDPQQVTDPDDVFIDTNGNLNGYLDKNAVFETHKGKLWVAWETTERKKGGSMIVVRSLNDLSWGPIKEIGGVEDTNIDTMPDMISYKGALYLVWEQASSDDTDILCMVYDLAEWTSCPEVSEKDDFGMDSDVDLAIFRGRLWAAWVTRSVVTGMDKGGGDIVVRSFNGQDWSDEITIVNPTPANGWDETPKLAVFNDKLVVAWITRDDDISNGTDTDLVFREYDGESWGQIREVTATDGPGDDDTYPNLAIFDDRLHFIWQSEGDRQDETDIHHASYDGSKISNEENIVPEDNVAADEHPVAVVYKKALYVAWNSNDAALTSGNDDDIVINILKDGAWKGAQEVTKWDFQGERGTQHTMAAQDRFPKITTYNGALYILWEQDDQRASLIDPGDLLYVRYPPPTEGVNMVLMALIVIAIVVMVIAIVTNYRSKKRSKKVARFEERERIRRKAISKAGGKGRSRRKGGKGRSRKHGGKKVRHKRRK